MKTCIAVIVAVFQLVSKEALGQSAGPRSYTAESMTCGLSQDGNNDLDVLYPLDYQCDSLLPPSAWQKKSNDADVDYDLIIVGGGIGGAYLANRVVEEFQRKNQEPPKIALFERTDLLGGRLQSGYASGALGLSVAPRLPNNAEGLPLQEYGGMRIDPYRYPLIFNKVIQMGQALYGTDRCKDFKECRVIDNCCPDMLDAMEVGGVRYATTREDLGVLSQSTVLTSSQVYNVTSSGKVVSAYSLQNIAEGVGSPFDKCMQLVVAATEYYKDLSDLQRSIKPWKEAIEGLCADCDTSNITGMCNLCESFPKPAEAVISCSGYDVLEGRSLSSVAGLVEEVLNVKRGTFLYLLKFGFQRFVMSLLEGNGTIGIAPQYRKMLVRLSLDNGDNATLLAEEQANSLPQPEQYDVVPNPTKIYAHFGDGTTVSAKALYLGMLPFDLALVAGLEPWDGPLNDVASTSVSTKMVLGWKDPSKALPAVLGMTPCVPGPCQRLILDGNHSDGWMPRQVWLWDAQTILIYDVGRKNTNDTLYPADTMQQMAALDMDVLVITIMQQIRDAINLPIDDPDWARLKPWPQGTFTSWQVKNMTDIFDTTPAQFGAHISRPLGYNVSVYYGNSEASPNNDNHGWVEGALEMVENNLQSLATYLGLEGKIVSPSRDTIDVAEAIALLEAEEAQNKSMSGNSTGGGKESGASYDLGSTMSFWVTAVWFTLAIVM